MRVLTVRQPWAWAIIHGQKDVENRSRNIAGSYRGPIAIHAGLQYDEDAAILGRTFEWFAVDEDGSHREPRGAIIGVVDLVDVHRGSSVECDCHPDWAFLDMWHGVLANPRPLTNPIPHKGKLGLRHIDADLEARIWAEVAA